MPLAIAGVTSTNETDAFHGALMTRVGLWPHSVAAHPARIALFHYRTALAVLQCGLGEPLAGSMLDWFCSSLPFVLMGC